VAVSPQPKENKPPMSNPASSFFTVSPSFQNLELKIYDPPVKGPAAQQ
jgi:hypothetical protein